MDPEQALKDARKALADFNAACDAPEGTEDYASLCADAAVRFATAFEALDGWLSKGGFLPQDWRAFDASAKAATEIVSIPQAQARRLVALLSDVDTMTGGAGGVPSIRRDAARERAALMAAIDTQAGEPCPNCRGTGWSTPNLFPVRCHCHE